ncbi:polysaccharide deacetylase family protein [Paraurantiacibacter namhicola]|uniref:WalW protein n=1 Tax=Paraurantiacibacter namhicola TaxID=645517 RepID=A0A1C7DA45_9SPHN|nr:polysaccharide deacetylase family protein [Paraurantiacibacter namhicola]ANU08305.1 hypothetical protein A6F65_02016 [Paraurantiacibacter namhicola]
MDAIDRPPTRHRPARFAQGFGQRFILTVDTEEEFDWSRPLSREEHGLEHVSQLGRFQQFCAGQGVVPIYLIDWPIAQSRLAAEILKPALDAGEAEIGVQLHPWVNPPFEEEVTERHSYARNLPPELERAKLLNLRDAIEANFGHAPLIYRAGRYGAGGSTPQILREAGIAIDTSVRTKFDYAAAGGPDYTAHPLEPYWLDDAKELLELPLTTVFWGLLRQMGDALFPVFWRAPRLRGVASKLGLLERIALTPEGIPIEDALKGTDIAIDMGLPILNFSFHSPSLAPGHTPYVRDEADLDALYDWWRRIFAHLAARDVKPASVSQVMDAVVR